MYNDVIVPILDYRYEIITMSVLHARSFMLGTLLGNVPQNQMYHYVPDVIYKSLQNQTTRLCSMGTLHLCCSCTAVYASCPRYKYPEARQGGHHRDDSKRNFSSKVSDTRDFWSFLQRLQCQNSVARCQ